LLPLFREMVGGVNDEERARGCTSFFSADTEGAVGSVGMRAPGDTIVVDFRDFSAAVGDAPGVTSFLPPGIMWVHVPRQE
jgi:hypothetical protein